MVMKPSGVIEMAYLNFPSFLRQREKVKQLDLWIKGNQQEYDGLNGQQTLGKPYSPQGPTREYLDISNRAPTPWGGLIVKSLAQTTYVDGMRRKGSKDNLEVWGTWQQNRFDAKQIPLHQAAIGHGLAFGMALPGRDPITRARMARMRPISGKRMAAFYDTEDDEWPRFAIEADPIPSNQLTTRDEWTVSLVDEEVVHYLSCEGDGRERNDWTYISYESHTCPVPPVVRYAGALDLDGKAMGEIEPIIPLLSRIDQDTFDRLIVQRFGAWKIRYIAGLAKPSTDDERRAVAMRLRIEDLLISPDSQTKFGTIEETALSGFIEAGDADLRVLAAITQTPPHHLLGLSSNLQAEALAAAEAGLQRKSGDFKMLNGENHEQFLRLTAYINGNKAEATAYDMATRWRDTESRSLVQAANALGIMATSLKLPLEMCWERLPNWTDDDTARAKLLVETGSFDKLMEQIIAGDPSVEEPPRQTGGSENEPGI